MLELQPDAGAESQLVERLKKREPEAMAELYDRYRRLVFFVVFRTVGNVAITEELMQETFLRVWNSIHVFDRERGNLATWVIAVARNRAIDYQRSKECRVAQATAPLERASFAATVEDPERMVLDRDMAHALGRAMEKLTPRQRTLLTMAFSDGLTHAELADRLGRPLGTVKTWIRSAIHALRAEMGVVEA
jgi:RNA polymerase sigma-70 factor (ECF subfamily)